MATEEPPHGSLHQNKLRDRDVIHVLMKAIAQPRTHTLKSLNSEYVIHALIACSGVEAPALCVCG